MVKYEFNSAYNKINNLNCAFQNILILPYGTYKFTYIFHLDIKLYFIINNT